MEAIGSNGRMILDGDKLTISRKGTGFITAMNLGLQGDKVIPVAQITAVELKPPGTFLKGYIRLSINGRDPVGGLREAVQDENAVLMAHNTLSDFERLRDSLVEAITRRSSAAQAAAISVADEIEKLAALRDRGLLTDAELSARKRTLLGI
jgi:hypothetical protein